jgi:hypothetical protein
VLAVAVAVNYQGSRLIPVHGEKIQLIEILQRCIYCINYFVDGVFNDADSCEDYIVSMETG